MELSLQNSYTFFLYECPPPTPQAWMLASECNSLVARCGKIPFHNLVQLLFLVIIFRGALANFLLGN